MCDNCKKCKLMKNQTEGQRRVRASFNPSDSSLVDIVKEKFSDIIDFLDNVKSEFSIKHHKMSEENFKIISGDFFREIATAKTEAENACHWAVKAVTNNLTRETKDYAQTADGGEETEGGNK